MDDRAATTVQHMDRPLRHASSFATLAAASLLTSLSFAHIDLQEPEPRAHGTGGGETADVNSDQKVGPCGQSTNGRTADRVTTYDPGETITIRLNEEINHASYYRVSLNPNGDTFPTRAAAPVGETLEAALAAEQALDQPGDADGRLLGVFADNGTANNNEASFQVTLPVDLECQNCTLQVIQFMYDRPNPYYFQCADLVIGEGDTGGESPDAGAGGSANAGEGGASLGGTGGAPAGTGGTGNLSAGGAPPVGAAGAPGSAGTAATGAGGTSTTPGAAGVGAPIVAGDDADEDSGCSVAPGTSASLLGVGSLVLFALSAMRRRSRRA